MEFTSANVFIISIITLLSSLNVLHANIVQVGNAILPSSAGANWDGTTFLLNDVILKRGVIFAFSAYFVEVRPVKFQLWRPAGGTNLFVLLDEWQFVPTNKGQREDFYIHTQQDNKCVTIEETDRLGLYTAQSPGSVGFNFDGVNAQAYTYTERNLTLSPSIGDTVSFDALSYPYRFSAAAYIDTDMSSYANPDDPACPVALQIPYTDEELGIVGSDPITTQAPITGAPGQQGATGATGPGGNVGGTGPMGSMGATGASGPAGAVGATGPAGANGLPGDFGQPGPIGATGPQGPAGPAGPPGIAGPAVGSSSTLDQYEDCTWCWRIFNPYTNLGFLIWLLILTIVNIVLVVVVACRRRDQINYNSNLRWSGSQGDLWKTFEDQQSKAGYDNGGAEPAYSYVEEGRTAF